jgi:hypothetical protein
MLSASVSCADPSWGPGLHRDELRQTGRSPAPAIGHEQQFARDQTSHSRLAPGESCASPEAAVGVASISSARVLVSRI